MIENECESINNVFHVKCIVQIFIQNSDFEFHDTLVFGMMKKMFQII
jgi:hypothetical protein